MPRTAKLSTEEREKNYIESVRKHHQSESYREYQKRYRTDKFRKKIYDSLEREGISNINLKRIIEEQDSILGIKYVLEKNLPKEEYIKIL